MLPVLKGNQKNAKNVRLFAVCCALFLVLCYVILGTTGGQLAPSSRTNQKYPAVSCPAVLRDTRAEGADFENMDPNNGTFYGKLVDRHPRFWISLHNRQFDGTRWGIMNSGDYYEAFLSNAFAEVLKDAPPGARVIDVGGNIGFFTLLSAANGPVGVDVFEPNPKNRLRMCESLLLNHWHSEFDNQVTSDPLLVSKVNLYPFGIGRKEGIFRFENNANPGQGKVREIQVGPGGDGLQIITLDNFAGERGWFQPQTRPHIRLLKVDVEGFEYSVIEGATKLLKAKIVENVFMEVSARNPKEIDINKPALKLLAQSGYKLHKVGGWRGPKNPVEFAQNDETIADHIMNKTLEMNHKQLNLWWKLGR
jgi:FkbM family methyltransferase